MLADIVVGGGVVDLSIIWTNFVVVVVVGWTKLRRIRTSDVNAKFKAVLQYFMYVNGRRLLAKKQQNGNLLLHVLFLCVSFFRSSRKAHNLRGFLITCRLPLRLAACSRWVLFRSQGEESRYSESGIVLESS